MPKKHHVISEARYVMETQDSYIAIRDRCVAMLLASEPLFRSHTDPDVVWFERAEPYDDMQIGGVSWHTSTDMRERAVAKLYELNGWKRGESKSYQSSDWEVL